MNITRRLLTRPEIDGTAAPNYSTESYVGSLSTLVDMDEVLGTPYLFLIGRRQLRVIRRDVMVLHEFTLNL